MESKHSQDPNKCLDNFGLATGLEISAQDSATTSILFPEVTLDHDNNYEDQDQYNMQLRMQNERLKKEIDKMNQIEDIEDCQQQKKRKKM